MNGNSYDDLDCYFENSFQPLISPRGRFDSFKWNWWYGRAGSIKVKFGPDISFIVPASEIIDIVVWVHEFIEMTISGIITNTLKLKPFINIPVYLFNKEVGWWKVCFCHLLAALTTGQRWKDKKNNYHTTEAGEVWVLVKSAVKNNLKEDIKWKGVKNV